MNQDREDNTVKTVEQSKAYILRELFLSTFYLSAFTFGGGYVIVTLLKRKFVDELHWIDDEEMLDLVAIAQSSPGLSLSMVRSLSAISLQDFLVSWSLSSALYFRPSSLFRSSRFFIPPSEKISLSGRCFAA